MSYVQEAIWVDVTVQAFVYVGYWWILVCGLSPAPRWDGTSLGRVGRVLLLKGFGVG